MLGWYLGILALVCNRCTSEIVWFSIGSIHIAYLYINLYGLRDYTAGFKKKKKKKERKKNSHDHVNA